MTMGCRCHNVKVDAIVLAYNGLARRTYRVTMHGYLVGPGYVHAVDDVAAALRQVGVALEHLTDLD